MAVKSFTVQAPDPIHRLYATHLIVDVSNELQGNVFLFCIFTVLEKCKLCRPGTVFG
jgi:hypothetical protein